MEGLALDGHPLVEPLLEEGLYSVTQVLVGNVSHSLTTAPPPAPSEENENPQGISLIILGTLLAFGCAALIVFVIVNAYKQQSCQVRASKFRGSRGALKTLHDR